MKVMISVILLSLFSLVGCSKPPVEVLKIGSNVWPGYELFFLARDKGYLSSDEVRLVELPNSTNVSQGLMNGNIHGGLLTLDEAIRLVDAGLPLKVILLVDFSRGGDVIIAREPWSGDELRNRTIAVESSAVGALMLEGFKQARDLKEDDLSVQYISVDQSERVFQDGTDLVVTFEPFRSRLLNMGGHQVFDSAEIPDLIVDALVVREDMLEPGHQVYLENMIASFFKAMEYLDDNPIEAAPILNQRQKISEQEVLSAYEVIILADAETNRDYLMGQSPRLINAIDKINNVLLKSSIIKAPVNSANMIDSSYIDRQ
jgi:NitT/TauT family transport system substrate-binding protein